MVSLAETSVLVFVLELSSAAAGLASGEVTSSFASAPTDSLKAGSRPWEGEASDIVTTALVAGIEPLASAVRACSRRDVEIEDACPTVDRSSIPSSGMAGLVTELASAPLSDFVAGASVFGSPAIAGCGANFCATSSGWEKLAGDISPGVTMTRAPILVQFHIFVANDIGIRMQPCDAG